MEKYGFVYIWRDKGKNRYYLGAHWGTVDDGYICSSNWMRDAKARRPHDFRRRIIASNVASQEELWNIEYEWLQLIDEHELGTKYYNKHREKYRSGTWKGLKHTEETKKKMSEARFRFLANGGKNWNDGKKHSEETKEKLRKRWKEGKANGRTSWNKGIPMREESKEKLRRHYNP